MRLLVAASLAVCLSCRYGDESAAPQLVLVWSGSNRMLGLSGPSNSDPFLCDWISYWFEKVTVLTVWDLDLMMLVDWNFYIDWGRLDLWVKDLDDDSYVSGLC